MKLRHVNLIVFMFFFLCLSHSAVAYSRVSRAKDGATYLVRGFGYGIAAPVPLTWMALLLAYSNFEYLNKAGRTGFKGGFVAGLSVWPVAGWYLFKKGLHKAR